MDIDKIKLLTKELIKYRTVRPNNGYVKEKNDLMSGFVEEINNCMNFISKSLNESIIVDRAKQYIDDISYPLMIAKLQDSMEPDILMVGHIDVVAGEDSQFYPIEKDGKIYGRGAKDMKSGVAAMMEIMNHYASKGKRPNIAMAIVSDEESGGFKGSGLIVNKIGYRPKFVITPDPGERHCLINKEKGFIWFSVIVPGISSHPSRPWLGECAFTTAFKILNRIDDKFNIAKSEDDWKTSATINSVNKVFRNADRTFSVDTSASVAGMVKCKIDIRYTENEDVDEIKSQLELIVKKQGDKNKIQFDNIGPVCYTPVDNKFVKLFKQSADVVEGKDIPLLPSCGASDMRFFSEKGIPCLTYGPTGKNHHGLNEYVDINSIETFSKTMIRYIDDNV
jgi:succinyl-diaminopimelate desuccinylase